MMTPTMMPTMTRKMTRKTTPKMAPEKTPNKTPMKTIGLYVHVPFCDRVCPYCDFAVIAPAPTRQGEARYVKALLRELEARSARYKDRSLATLYFGGGTPSLMSPESIAQIVEAARSSFCSDAADALEEITLEVNPSTLERARLPDFKAAGIDRLSLGIQSFNDRTLKHLGRAHRAQESWQTLEAARTAGFDNLSVDLIYAAPHQSFADFETDLGHLLDFAPEHCSAYELTIEAGTPFALADSRAQLGRTDEDTVARMYETLAARGEAAGLHRYEISNYARPGFEARHNARYWRREPVLGIGVGAFSSEPPTSDSPFGGRCGNTRVLGEYYARVEAGESAETMSESHSEAEARSEAIFLSLRRREGVDAAAFEAEFGVPLRALHGKAIDDLVSRELLIESPGGDVRLSAAGQLISDSVFGCFI